jgi:formimidoylglutamase
VTAPLIPHTSAGVWPAIRPGRFAQTIQRDSAANCQLALLGLPDDTGVALNGGRLGASAGPSALRAALASFGTPWDGLRGQTLTLSVFDAGDVQPVAGEDEAALLATHERVEAAVSALHQLGLTPLCVGGGHDLSLPSIRALSKHLGRPLSGINVDAHLDVRERVGSGMAFRRLIEGRFLEPSQFVTYGVGRFVNDQADAAWLASQGGCLLPVEQTDLVDAEPEALLARTVGASGAGFLSVDLDGLDASLMPGVSAANPAGLTLKVVAALLEAAGKAPEIRHFDLMELCPACDPSGRSARVAAYLLLCFLAGFSRRPQ